MKQVAVLLAAALFLFFVPAVRAHVPSVWTIPSPDHAQTFAYGTETHRFWSSVGHPGHLLLFLDFTNDPFVDRVNQREYDHFSFSFPHVKLQPDGVTFAYRAPNGHLVPVARKSPGLLGVEEIRLLPNADLIIDLPRGYLTLMLKVAD